MLPCNDLDRICVAFDDPRLVANAGLMLPVTIAGRLGLGQLADSHLDLGDAPGRANVGDKMLTPAASALAGGDCIDDADGAGLYGQGSIHAGDLPAQSPVGTCATAGPCEQGTAGSCLGCRGRTRGRAADDRPRLHRLRDLWVGQGGSAPHNYSGQRGYHPLLAVAAETGDVLMARLRKGRANTARGAAHFLRETVSRVRYAGATGALTVRADSDFYTRGIITVRQHRGLRDLIEAIPEVDWTPIPYWMEGAAAVAETTYTPFRGEPDTTPVRLIVRRVRPTPGSQLALFTSYSYHAFITDREGDTLELEADHRRHAEIENAIRDLKYGVGLNHLPSGRFAANAAWMAVQVLAHNLARWTSRIGLGEQVVTTRTLRRRFFALAGRLTRSARRLTLHLPQGWPWGNLFSGALARLRSLPAPV